MRGLLALAIAVHLTGQPCCPAVSIPPGRLALLMQLPLTGAGSALAGGSASCVDGQLDLSCATAINTTVL